MIAFFLPALLMSADPEPCGLPESMPALNEWVEGEGDTDWCLRGIDALAVAGPDLNPPPLLVSQEDENAGGAQIFQWRRGFPPEPVGWRPVFSLVAPASVHGDFNEVLVQKLSDHVIVVTVNPAWRVGNAICAGETGPATGYLLDGVSPTAADADAIDDMSSVADPREPGNIMCMMLVRDGSGYRAVYHGPRGRPLAEVNEHYSHRRIRLAAPGDYGVLLGISR